MTIKVNFNEYFHINNAQGNIPAYLVTLGSLVSIMLVGYRLVVMLLENKYQNFVGSRL